jgi:hypothetical protein
MADQWTMQAGVYMIYESSEIDNTALSGGGKENLWVTQMSVFFSSLL